MQFPRIATALAVLVLAAPAHAAAPDRSSLSYEDNVSINTACYEARTKGEGAFQSCVQAQLIRLQTHPAPDRTGLSERRTREIESDCAYLRRIGIAEYNDCMANAIDAAPKPAASEDQDTPASNASLAKALTEADLPLPAANSPDLPQPKSVLPPLPDHMGRANLPAADLYKRVERSVFVVGAARSLGDARARDIVQGSAVAIAAHLLLTNCHVVDHRPMIVLLQDHVTYRAKLVASDPVADRCVLESEGGALVPIAGVRSFTDIAVGEHVYAIGAPRALERTLSEGLVSGKRAAKGRNLIQTSAPLSPGSSGGGLFDERGNLLGITTLASLPGSQNLNFAISAADFWD
ncbi:MAG TPA: serine protease [Stellaceae bacterium]|nr:serine protease [Stellaceae bacterium]